MFTYLVIACSVSFPWQCLHNRGIICGIRKCSLLYAVAGRIKNLILKMSTPDAGTQVSEHDVDSLECAQSVLRSSEGL